eukprot:maker-scaffold_4-snap-gene-2.44-mRNA-1 protein AED:0.00 eAED:0.00 QI:35/1/1/1/1/1/2/543/232
MTKRRNKQTTETIPTGLEIGMQTLLCLSFTLLLSILHNNIPKLLFPLITPFFQLLYRQVRFFKYKVDLYLKYSKGFRSIQTELGTFYDPVHLVLDKDYVGIGRQDAYFFGAKVFDGKQFILNKRDRDPDSGVASLKAMRIIKLGLVCLIPLFLFSWKNIIGIVFYFLSHALFAWYFHGSQPDPFQEQSNRYKAAIFETLFSGLLIFNPLFESVVNPIAFLPVLFFSFIYEVI